MKRRGFFKAALGLVGLKALGVESTAHGVARDLEVRTRRFPQWSISHRHIWRMTNCPTGKAVIVVDHANDDEWVSAANMWYEMKRNHPGATLTIENLNGSLL